MIGLTTNSYAKTRKHYRTSLKVIGSAEEPLVPDIRLPTRTSTTTHIPQLDRIRSELLSDDLDLVPVDEGQGVFHHLGGHGEVGRPARRLFGG